jgi:predicted NUDIX family NTP pyrophosphohydrolase
VRKRVSAGLLLYRRRYGQLEVLLAHPGGPFFRKKDEGYWSIPKGEPGEGEELLDAAIREFEEETGITPAAKAGDYINLGSIVQKGGKEVFAWAVEGDYVKNPDFKSNEFEMEWPPRSGKMMMFPEIDKVEFFPVEEAKKKIKERQRELIDKLVQIVK